MHCKEVPKERLRYISLEQFSKHLPPYLDFQSRELSFNYTSLLWDPHRVDPYVRVDALEDALTDETPLVQFTPMFRTTAPQRELIRTCLCSTGLSYCGVFVCGP